MTKKDLAGAIYDVEVKLGYNLHCDKKEFIKRYLNGVGVAKGFKKDELQSILDRRLEELKKKEFKSIKKVKENKLDETKETFKNKAELISYIEKYTNVTLENDPADLCNKKRYILHTVINKNDRLNVLSFLNKRGIRVEQHIYDSYFIYLK